jgi:hypothetical protein
MASRIIEETKGMKAGKHVMWQYVFFLESTAYFFDRERQELCFCIIEEGK